MFKNLEKLMAICSYTEYGDEPGKNIEMALKNGVELNKQLMQHEFKLALETTNLNWVDMAVKNKLVYTSDDYPPYNFSLDELLIFTDKVIWESTVRRDALLTLDQKHLLKEQFKDIGIQNYVDIFELLKCPIFNWIPFEVQHVYKRSFGKMVYTNSDIIYYFKILISPFLFPNSQDLERLLVIEKVATEVLISYNQNDKWLECDQLITTLSTEISDLSLYELSQVKWNKSIEHKNHFRNPFTLGFKRFVTS